MSRKIQHVVFVASAILSILACVLAACIFAAAQRGQQGTNPNIIQSPQGRKGLATTHPLEHPRDVPAIKHTFPSERRSTSATSSVALLGKFRVELLTQPDRLKNFYGYQLTATNETGQAISVVKIVAKFMAEGRSVPALRQEFNYRPRSGIEAGESQTWDIRWTQEDIGAIYNSQIGHAVIETVALHDADGRLIAVKE